MKKALALGVAASFFFAFTFVLNRSMNIMGGCWIYSASLRYFFTLPIMAAIVFAKKDINKVHSSIRANPKEWLLWSIIGFGMFYAPLCLAGDCGESWLIAASWQMTIVMGVLLTPVFGRKIPLANLICSIIILSGVFMLQINNLLSVNVDSGLLVLLPVAVAALSYPLGNRKMMVLCGGTFSILERVYGMTLCSMPMWVVLFITGLLRVGPPAGTQIVQSLGVAVFSGIVATVLFFRATDIVRNNQRRLAVIESTQAGEVIFSLIGGVFVLGDPPPNVFGCTGIVLIIIGIIVNSIFVR